MPDTCYRAWVEIDRSALRHNLENLKRLVAPSGFMAVVKAEAYGHGMLEVARVAVEVGAWGLAVVNIDEGLRLRAAGFRCRVVVVGPVFGFEVPAALAQDLSLPVYSLEQAREVSQAAVAQGRLAAIHLKLDTGLGRLAVPSSQAREFLSAVKELPGLRLEGIYSHYADAEGLDQSYTLQQFRRFQEVLQTARELGMEPQVRHISASAAGMLLQEARLDLVRLGIAMYGLWPAEETRILMASRGGDLLGQINIAFSAGQAPALDQLLRPVLSYKTRVAQVKELPNGSPLGYGCTTTLSRDSRVAILPVGYAEGYDRHLSNRGEVLIAGRRARVLGRVCMNMTTVDVTDIPDVQAGQEVILIGGSISAEEVASKIGTINYELVTRIPQQIPRVYL